ncbi:hypothetical protein SLE2022_219300 [Rubroshorea leprosula]
MVQRVRTRGHKALFDTITGIDLSPGRVSRWYLLLRTLVVLLMLEWLEVKFASKNFSVDQRAKGERGMRNEDDLFVVDSELEIVEFMKQKQENGQPKKEIY